MPRVSTILKAGFEPKLHPARTSQTWNQYDRTVYNYATQRQVGALVPSKMQHAQKFVHKLKKRVMRKKEEISSQKEGASNKGMIPWHSWVIFRSQKRSWQDLAPWFWSILVSWYSINLQ
jgi:hypothetical protein